MKLPITGTCQCGQVSYTLDKEPLITVACHCRDCQKLSASAFSITMVFTKDAFELSSGELKVYERPAEYGGSVLCHFCPTCGNRVYHESLQFPDLLRLKPGGLDDTSQIVPQAHLWTSRAQPWFRVPDDLPVYDTQPDLGEFIAGLRSHCGSG